MISDEESIPDGWKYQKNSLQLLNGYHFCLFIKADHSIVTLEPELNSHKKLAYVVFTSGTTGPSKLVKVPHSCIVPNILDLRYK